jgi:hypothetical protein
MSNPTDYLRAVKSRKAELTTRLETLRVRRLGLERTTEDITARVSQLRLSIVRDEFACATAAQHRDPAERREVEKLLSGFEESLREVHSDNHMLEISERELVREVARISRELSHLDEISDDELRRDNSSRVVGVERLTPRCSRDVVNQAVNALGRIPTWVPRRICEEEIGDALEQIHRFAREAAPGWEQQVRRKVMSTKFWVLVHAIREVVSAALGKKRA